jgi:F-type H+-transporting ATPase subunit b
VQIDWLTVSAQIVNFLILIALLRRFLYRPVLDAMDRREQRIAEQRRDAERREAEADKREREFRDKSADLDRRREELLDQARDEAETERQERLQEVRSEVEHQRERWHAQLEQEWESARAALSRRLAQVVTEAARRVLADLADSTLEEAMTRAFERRLADLSESDRRAMAEDAGRLEVATGFEPTDETRRALTEAVREHFDRDVRFVRGDDLVGGIELRAQGWKLSWTVAEYLQDIEKRVDDTIAATTHHVRR